jgi:hypothetical protein
MNCIATAFARDCNDLRNVEICSDPLPAQRDALIPRANMQRSNIILGMDRHTGNVQIGSGARDADRDFAAIGDEKLPDHCRRCTLKRRTYRLFYRVVAVEIHDLAPGGHEVLDELRLCVRTRIHLGKRAKLRVRAQHQIRAGAAPFQLTR